MAQLRFDQSINLSVEVDKFAGDAGVPQQADNAVNDAVDTKVNDEIPGGN